MIIMIIIIAGPWKSTHEKPSLECDPWSPRCIIWTSQAMFRVRATSSFPRWTRHRNLQALEKDGFVTAPKVRTSYFWTKQDSPVRFHARTSPFYISKRHLSCVFSTARAFLGLRVPVQFFQSISFSIYSILPITSYSMYCMCVYKKLIFRYVDMTHTHTLLIYIYIYYSTICIYSTFITYIHLSHILLIVHITVYLHIHITYL
jgi:hypothetical protein